MTVAADMLRTTPADTGYDAAALAACIDACFECAQACTACAMGSPSGPCFAVSMECSISRRERGNGVMGRVLP